MRRSRSSWAPNSPRRRREADHAHGIYGRYQIRDANTGAVLSSADNGLRMGADYSWSRGAVRLIKDQLLEKKAQRMGAAHRT